MKEEGLEKVKISLHHLGLTPSLKIFLIFEIFPFSYRYRLLPLPESQSCNKFFAGWPEWLIAAAEWRFLRRFSPPSSDAYENYGVDEIS